MVRAGLDNGIEVFYKSFRIRDRIGFNPLRIFTTGWNLIGFGANNLIFRALDPPPSTSLPLHNWPWDHYVVFVVWTWKNVTKFIISNLWPFGTITCTINLTLDSSKESWRLVHFYEFCFAVFNIDCPVKCGRPFFWLNSKFHFLNLIFIFFSLSVWIEIEWKVNDQTWHDGHCSKLVHINSERERQLPTVVLVWNTFPPFAVVLELNIEKCDNLPRNSTFNFSNDDFVVFFREITRTKKSSLEKLNIE